MHVEYWVVYILYLHAASQASSSSPKLPKKKISELSKPGEVTMPTTADFPSVFWKHTARKRINTTKNLLCYSNVQVTNISALMNIDENAKLLLEHGIHSRRLHQKPICPIITLHSLVVLHFKCHSWINPMTLGF